MFCFTARRAKVVRGSLYLLDYRFGRKGVGGMNLLKIAHFFRNGILERRNKFVRTKLTKFNDRPISNVKYIYLTDDT